jgi:hypothetical protein
MSPKTRDMSPKTRDMSPKTKAWARRIYGINRMEWN